MAKNKKDNFNQAMYEMFGVGKAQEDEFDDEFNGEPLIAPEPETAPEIEIAPEPEIEAEPEPEVEKDTYLEELVSGAAKARRRLITL